MTTQPAEAVKNYGSIFNLSRMDKIDNGWVNVYENPLFHSNQHYGDICKSRINAEMRVTSVPNRKIYRIKVTLK